MNKRKIITGLLAVNLALPLMMGLGDVDGLATDDAATSSISTRAASTSPTVDITLHKLLNATTPEYVQNTGSEMVAGDFYTKPGDKMIYLPDVTFQAFNVSDLFAELRKTKSSTEAYNELSGREWQVTKAGLLQYKDTTTNAWVTAATTATETVTTGDEGATLGKAVFNDLAKKTVLDNGTPDDTSDDVTVDSAYLFMETAAPAEVVTKAAPLLITLPAYEYDAAKQEYSDTELDEVHLYPKNESKTGDLYGEKVTQAIKGGEIVNKPLNGAQFVIHDKYTDIENYDKTKELFLGAADPTTGVRKWVTIDDAEKFTTTIVNSVKGVLYIEGLAQGSYRLSEIHTVVDPTTNEEKIEIGGNTLAGNNTVYNVPFEINLEKETDDAKADAVLTNKLINDDIIVDKDNPGGALDYGASESYTAESIIPVGMNEVLANNNPRYTTYTITDIHDAALSLDEASLKLSVNGTVIDGYKVEDVADPEDGKAGFVISFANPKASLGAYAGEIIDIEYKMVLAPGATPDTDFDNTITIKTNFDEDSDSGKKVFTGGRKFIKVDAANGAALEGAEFYFMKGTEILYKDKQDIEAKEETETTPAVPAQEVDGNYFWYTPAATEGVPETVVNNGTTYYLVTKKSDAEGKFEIKGLDYDTTAGTTYTLMEKATSSDRYILPEKGFVFTVNKGSYALINSFATEKIENYAKGSLPSTGGSGIVAFVLIGVVAVGGAVLYFTKGRRQIEG